MDRRANRPARNRLDRDEWSRFWQRGTLTTFEGHFRENYDADIEAFWWREFGAMREGAAILDLATGNGALALLAARYGREQGRNLDITGVDSATIDPARLAAAHPGLAADLERVTLLGGTPLEATGLPAGSVDLVTSQYGFEYGDTAAGATEAARLLVSGGRLAMILHHRDSAILAQAREGLRQVGLCLDDERLLVLARRMVKLIRGLKPTSDGRGLHWSPGALKVREDLMAVAGRLDAEARDPQVRAADAGFIEFLLPSVMRLVERARSLGAPALDTAWAGIEREAETYRLRMADLASAALDEAGMARVRSELEAAGFTAIETGPFHYRGSLLLGWRLRAQRG